MTLSTLSSTIGLSVSANDWLGLSFRLIFACLLGAMIGYNRQAAGKPAGLRTHMLVSLGAALFVMIPSIASPSNSGDALSRTIQGVATGVGFLGAGEILHHSVSTSGKPSIKGLTSAATIWLTAALGMVAGCGLWQLGLLAALITVFILSVVKKLERVIFHRDD